MGSTSRTVTPRELDSYEQQFRALHKDWHYFYKLIKAYGDPRADSERRRALEMAFLELKGRISCDYSVLAAWRSGACGIPAGIGDVFSEGTTLKSLADDVARGGRIEDEWKVVDDALGYVRQLLAESREKTRPGKAVRLPAALFSECRTSQAIEKHNALVRSLQADWRRVHELIAAFGRPGADRRDLENQLFDLKNKIACEYPTLPAWFGGRDEVSKSLARILDGNATLAKLVEANGIASRTLQDWQSVDASIGVIRSRLSRAQIDLARGKAVSLPHGLIVQSVHRPFPWRKVLMRTAALLIALLAVGSVYFLRTFVGIGAPQPGAGIVMSASLADEEQAVAILSIMNESFVRGDVDTFMTAIARDFSDDEGNGRRALRIVLQTYHTAGKFTSASVIWNRAEFSRVDEWLYANPVIIRSSLEGERDLYLNLGFKQYGGRWLIASAAGYN